MTALELPLDQMIVAYFLQSNVAFINLLKAEEGVIEWSANPEYSDTTCIIRKVLEIVGL